MKEDEVNYYFDETNAIDQTSELGLFEINVKHRRIEKYTTQQVPELDTEGYKIFSYLKPFFLMEHLCVGDPYYEEYDDVFQIVPCENRN